MYFIYSILLSTAFLLMLPLFLLRREKYAAGFTQRLGNYPEFKQDGRRVIWLHCVSVGEANAARPLVDGVVSEFPDHRVVISTTTKTGQELAKKIFAGKADAVFYFPFDWKFSVRKALGNFKPSVVLLMETEIWPRFIHEAKLCGAKVAIVNGRLSERSFARYRKVRGFLKRVLADVDLALMQGGDDANRLISLGLAAAKAKVTGNIKFDVADDPRDAEIAAELNARFRFDDGRPVIAAASTHDPEERWLLDAFCSILAGEAKIKSRLVIAPRHPERFADVARLLREFRDDEACEFKRYRTARRSDAPSEADAEADIILLDSIGELRALYQLTTIAFVGGSLIPHGGQSVLEPAAAGNAIITGPHTFNFADVMRVFLENNAVIQLPEQTNECIPDDLFVRISDLLEEPEERAELARNARAVMEANRGATAKTVELLRHFLN
ncbi:MAG: 3-deoxy-D-manno-octulosonic acid transferase [Acidobacteria bacterium]|nr:3-deoxy-D-manno-octulosonic acid transferase [Acidobacteriota bacterium]